MPFAALCAELTLMSGVLYVALAAGGAAALPQIAMAQLAYHRTCAAGFSAVLFGLKVQPYPRRHFHPHCRFRPTLTNPTP